MSIQTESNKELKALISLLDEPNEDNYVSISSEVLAYGKSAIPFLEDACLVSQSDVLTDRMKSIISKISFDDIYESLSAWAAKDSNDLLDAFLWISKLINSEIDEQKYLAEFHKIRKDVWLEINDNLTALEKVRVLNHIIYDYHMFSGQRSPNGNKLKLYTPDHLFDNKKGNSLTLGILYLAVAQDLDIPIYGVDLPGHFVLVYLDEKINLKPTSEFSRDEALFYLNAMNKGAVFTKNEIRSFVLQMNLKPELSHYSPCSNKTIIMRLINEVSQEIKLNGDTAKSKMLLNLSTALL